MARDEHRARAANAPAISDAIVVSVNAAICVPTGRVRSACSTIAPAPSPTSVTPAAMALSSTASAAVIDAIAAASRVSDPPTTTATIGDTRR